MYLFIIFKIKKITQFQKNLISKNIISNRERERVSERRSLSYRTVIIKITK
jgi:hypothetical protein